MGAILISVELFLAAFLCGMTYSLLKWGTQRLAGAVNINTSQRKLVLWQQNLRGITLLLFGLAITVILGFNGWLLYQGRDVYVATLQIFQDIPRDFWINLVVRLIQCAGIGVAIVVILKSCHPWLERASLWAQTADGISENDISIARFFRAFYRSLRNGLWLIGLLGCLTLLRFPATVLQYCMVVLGIYLTISVGQLILRGVAVFLDSLEGLGQRYAGGGSIFKYYNRCKVLIPFLRRCLEFAVWVCVATLVIAQVKVVANLASYGPVLVKAIGIVSISRILVEVSHLVLERLFLEDADHVDEIQCQRRGTLLPLLQSILRYLIYFGAAMAVLQTLGVNPGPILAGAGIVGLTIGLGAQSLVMDIFSGFFILFEDCYLVGDFIETKDALGVVKSIQLRTTRVLHPNGQMQILRNGDIGPITNYSKHPIDAVVKASISYEADPKRACEVIRRVGEELCKGDPDVLEATRIEGIEPFGESTILIYTRTKVAPGKHLRIKRNLRHQILNAFIQEDIEMVPMDTKLMLKGGFISFSNNSHASLSLDYPASAAEVNASTGQPSRAAIL